MSKMLPKPKKIPQGQAVQVVSLEERLGQRGVQAKPRSNNTGPPENRNRKLRFETPVFRDITRAIGDLPIVVIAIAGPARGGKSFMLSYIVRYLLALENGVEDWMEMNDPSKSTKNIYFTFQNGTERTTDGIWMWSKPFIITRPGSSDPSDKIAILLLDTEGCFDAYSSDAEQSRIIGLSLLTSSCFIFNESKKVNENTLTTLARFMQYGQLALEEFESKCFQRIMFLIRDWNNPSAHQFGAAGGKTFIVKYLKTDERMSDEAVENRQVIHNCFEDYNCYLMPFPGEEVISEDFEGSVGEMSMGFRDHIKNFIESLIKDVDCKKVASAQATGHSLFEMFAQYIDVFNHDDMPNPMSILKATVYSAYECHILQLVKLYKQKVELKVKKRIAKRPPLLPEHFQEIHNKIKPSILEKFNSLKSLPDPKVKIISAEKLEREIDRWYNESAQKLNESLSQLIQKAEEGGIQMFESILQQKMVTNQEMNLSLEEFQILSSSAGKAGLKEFLKLTGNPSDQIQQKIVPGFVTKIKQKIDQLEKELKEQLKVNQEKLTSVLSTLTSSYEENMLLLVGDDLRSEASLNQIHQRHLQRALSSFSTTAQDKGFKFKPECHDQFQQQLSGWIQKKFEQILQQNQSKLESIESIVQNIIQESVGALEEETREILSNMRTARVELLETAHQDVLEAAGKRLEEDVEDLVIASNFRQFKRQLNERLQQELDRAKGIITLSIQRSRTECQNLVEQFFNQFSQKLKELIDREKIVEKDQLTILIERLTNEVMNNFNMQTSQLNQMAPSDVISYRMQLQSLLKEHGDKLVRELESKKQQVEVAAQDMARKLKLGYYQEIRILEQESVSINDLEDAHNRLYFSAIRNLEQIQNLQNYPELLRQYKENLEHELQNQIETSKRIVQSRIDERQKNFKDALSMAVESYDCRLESIVQDNPFIAERSFKLEHDTLVEEEVRKLQTTLKNDQNNSKKEISRLVEELRELLKGRRKNMQNFVTRKRNEADESIQLLLDDCLVQLDNCLSLITDSSLSTQDLNKKFTESSEEAELLFDKKWSFPSGERKDSARRDLNKKMRQKIQMKSDELHVKKQGLNETFALATSSFCPGLEQDLAVGFVYSDDDLERLLNNGEKMSRGQLERDLEREGISGSIHLSEFDKKIERKRRDLRDQNRENLEKLSRETVNILENFNDRDGEPMELGVSEIRDKVLNQIQPKMRSDVSNIRSIEMVLDNSVQSVYNEGKKARQEAAVLKVRSKVPDLLRDYCTNHKSSIKNQHGLTTFERSMRSHVVTVIENDCGIKLSSFPELETFLNEAVQSTFEIVANELMSISLSKTEDILNSIVKDYNRRMQAKLPEGTTVNPDNLCVMNEECIELSLRSAEAKFSFISDSQRSIFRKRLDHSFQIFFEKNSFSAAKSANSAIGIDLGTTTSCVAIYQNNKVVVMKDIDGKTLTPSYVHYPETGSPVVGRAAKDAAFVEPENVIFDAKRLIGRAFKDEFIQKDIKSWPFEVQNDGNDKPKIVVRGKSYRPEEVSAQVLIRMKEVAKEYLGKEVTKAVITVPANFNDSQRDATRQAAQVAGLEVLQIINEPTAAALAHTLTWTDEAKIALVFDFGGGTFDVTILKTGSNVTIPTSSPSSSTGSGMAGASTAAGVAAATGGGIAPANSTESKSQGVSGIQILATLGDTHLGGEDFDTNLALYCAQEFEKERGVKLLEKVTDQSSTTNNPKAVNRRLRRLRDACEKAKVNLTTAESTKITLDAIYGDWDLNVDISRQKFEELNEPLFQRTIDCVKNALAEAKVTKMQVTDILMIGGSSRIPRVRKLLAEFLGIPSIHLDQKIDIQEAVAMGAAVKACILSGQEFAGNLPKIKDIQPFSLGIEVKGGFMSRIIQKNSEIPIEKEEKYMTTEDNQTSISIAIFSGENQMVKDNHELGRFNLLGVPPGPAGSQEVMVKMQIDASGILNVTATSLGSGASHNLEIKENRGRLSEAQIKEMRDRAQGF